MTNRPDQPDSLDREVTHTGGESQADPQRGRPAGDTVASLGEMQTGGDTRSSLSDLGDLEQAADGQEEIVDLESRYEILGPLGRGGMGEVVRAMDQRLKREVAIKRIREEFGTSRQAMQRFLTEAVSIAALNHYNVVQIYDYGHTAEGPFLVMELVEGPTLAELLQDGPLPLVDAAEMVYQLCDGLQAAHDRGLVHRDIKPANILMTASGTPKLTDFGLARDVTDTGMTRTGAVLGTLDYMAPEQKENASQVDARSDQWSLAATVYQMITGKAPRLIRLSDLPETLQPVIVRALEEDPAARYESVREFGQALRETINPTTGTAIERSSLQEGQCPGCGTVNEISRKFCQGCGASLLENCPECGDPGKVWMRYCGECGTDIPESLEARIESARELAGEVQSLRAGYRHSEALQRLTPLLETSLTALAEHRQWAEKTRQLLTHELAELQSQRDQLLRAAWEQSAQGNISAARLYLARIPDQLQDQESWDLDEELTRHSKEAKHLAREIREATRAKQYQGLAPKVERFLELQPNDERARKLLQKLQDRLRPAQQQSAEVPPKAGAASLVRSGMQPNRQISPVAIGGGVVIAVAAMILMTWIGSPERKPVESASIALGTGNTASPAIDLLSAPNAKTAVDSAPPHELTQRPDQPRNTPGTPPTDSKINLPKQFDSTIDPRTVEEAQGAQQAWASALGVDVTKQNSAGMRLTLIPPGEFLMGSGTSADELARVFDTKSEYFKDEFPQHRVQITRPFYLQTTEVTQTQWKAVMDTEPWKGKNNVRVGDEFPATYISWHDAQEFCRQLGIRDGNTYRLPTEAEWEYACRAGTTTLYHFGDESDRLGENAWFSENAADFLRTYAHEVGRKKPNPWGLFDMHGNVREWCLDGYEGHYYKQFSSTTAVDPSGPSLMFSNRAVRGGSWGGLARNCRGAYRFRKAPDDRNVHLGLRVVRELPGQPSQLAFTDQNSSDRPPAQRNLAPSLLAKAPPLFDATIARSASDAEAAQQEWAKSLGQSEPTITSSIGITFILIPPGEFLMGSSFLDSKASSSEKPQHRVQITRPFYLQTTEVTQAQWKVVMGTEPWKGERKKFVREENDFTATYISWHGAWKFCQQLGIRDGNTYRLPTEAEWEYACRAGTATRYHFGDESDRLGEYAWFEGNADHAGQKYAHEVGRKKPNPWGLFDMHGNVWEWCRDGYDENYYKQFLTRAAVDPQGPSSPFSYKVSRGGSWHSSAGYCRTAYRRRGSSRSSGFGDLGLRVVRELPKQRLSIAPATQSTRDRPPAQPNPVPSLPTKAPPLFNATEGSKTAEEARSAQWAWSEFRQIEIEEQNSIGMELALIPAGEFLMGSPESDSDSDDDEQPRHRVRITKPFYLGIHEVTQGQWQAVMGTEPWKEKTRVKEGDDFAAAYVSWDDAQEFCRKLGERDGDTYRLPTEAEWEYACRAGTTTLYHFGDSEAQLSGYAWFDQNAGEGDDNFVHPVGQKKPNSWGLYDLHGNVWEWCRDGYDEGFYRQFASKSAVDPQGPLSGFSKRVCRGGGWHASFDSCRAAFRTSTSSDSRRDGIGFRVVRELPDHQSEPAPADQNILDRPPAQRDMVQSMSSNVPPQFDARTARSAGDAQAAQQAWANYLEREVVETNNVGVRLTLIPPGEFLMGSPKSDSKADSDEQPQHRVRITRPYYLQATEVTQAQWKAVMGTEPWKGQDYVRDGAEYPAMYVSWEDTREFCRKLGERDGDTYRLPTEAEWEYACRAGTTTLYHFGENEDQLDKYAWFAANAKDADENYAHPVARKLPNSFGLFDMHGNVYEWCQDGYDRDYYQQFASKTGVYPLGPSSTVSGRVIRGGGWLYSASRCRSASRYGYSADYRGYSRLGFRVVRVLPGE